MARIRWPVRKTKRRPPITNHLEMLSMLRTPKAILFDMDGLMLNSEPLYERAWQQAGTDLGIQIDHEFYLSCLGRRRSDSQLALKQLFGEHFPTEIFWQKREQYWRHLVHQNGIPLQPGLLPLIDQIDALGLARAIATSNDSQSAIFCLQNAGLTGKFSTLLTGDRVAAGKPAPDIFLAAAQALGIDPVDCWVLEDSEAGIRGARAAGMTALMVPDMKAPSDEIRPLTHRILNNLSEVEQLLRQVCLTAKL